MWAGKILQNYSTLHLSIRLTGGMKRTREDDIGSITTPTISPWTQILGTIYPRSNTSSPLITGKITPADSDPEIENQN